MGGKEKTMAEHDLRTAVKELQDENDALRNLIHDLLPCYFWNDCCATFGCQNEGELYASCPRGIEKRLKELKITKPTKERR
jgi:hypothetical protein